MKENIKYYFVNNLKQYIIVSIVFLIGLLIGVLMINHSNDNQKEEIVKYIETSVESVKNSERINGNEIFFKEIKSNILMIILFGLLGSTIIGIPIVYFLVIYKGFSLGYTISSIIATLEIKKGIIFISSSLLLQNIVLIMAFFIITVSGTNLCRYILNNKRRDQIKFEILKHLIFLLISIILVIIAALLESYVSTNLINILKKYL